MGSQREVRKKKKISVSSTTLVPQPPEATLVVPAWLSPSPRRLHNTLTATGNAFPGGYRETKLGAFKNERVASDFSCIKELA